MKKIFPYLTYAGTIPFIFCALCLYANMQELPILGSIEKILSVYGLVIAAFLAGSHWGQHLHINNNKWVILLPVLSNIIAILLWFSFLILNFKILMVMYIAVFIVLLIIDYCLFRANLITDSYFKTRFKVSFIVIISLIISGTLQ